MNLVPTAATWRLGYHGHQSLREECSLLFQHHLVPVHSEVDSEVSRRRWAILQCRQYWGIIIVWLSEVMVISLVTELMSCSLVSFKFINFWKDEAKRNANPNVYSTIKRTYKYINLRIGLLRTETFIRYVGNPIWITILQYSLIIWTIICVGYIRNS